MIRYTLRCDIVVYSRGVSHVSSRRVCYTLRMILIVTTIRREACNEDLEPLSVRIIDIEVTRLAIVCPYLFRIMILCYSPRPNSG